LNRFCRPIAKKTDGFEKEPAGGEGVQREKPVPNGQRRSKVRTGFGSAVLDAGTPDKVPKPCWYGGDAAPEKRHEGRRGLQLTVKGNKSPPRKRPGSRFVLQAWPERPGVKV